MLRTLRDYSLTRQQLLSRKNHQLYNMVLMLKDGLKQLLEFD